MLIRFIVSNCLSFNDKTVFTMAAGKQTRLPDHLATINGKRILKGSCIFGANASGKSNFIKAFDLGREVVLSGIDDLPLYRFSFRPDSDTQTKPGTFQFDFTIHGSIYSYSFALDYARRTFTEESLVKVGTQNSEVIFLRVWDEETESYAIKAPFKEQKTDSRFEIYKEDFSRKLNRNRLFLTGVLNRLPLEEQYPEFRDVLTWFKNSLVITTESFFIDYGYYISDLRRKNELLNFLEHFDTGIHGIDLERIDTEALFNSPSLSAEEKKSILSAIKEINKTIAESQRPLTLSSDTAQYHLHTKDEKLCVDEILYRHGDPEEESAKTGDRFQYGEESDGTKRLINLLPVLSLLDKDRVIIIDELDRSLHTKAAQEFLYLFYTLNREHQSQLICTSHNLYLMDLNLFRQDEIWYMERDYQGKSHLFSLNKYNVRFDKKLNRDYLAGRFGGVPQFDPNFEGPETDTEETSKTDSSADRASEF